MYEVNYQPFIEFIQSNYILSLVWIGLVIALIFSVIKQKTAPYKVVSTNEATLLANHNNAVFIDIRSRDEFRSGHIAGSVNLLAKEIKAKNLVEIEKYKSAPIILVCKNAQAAIECANVLAKEGFDQINVLKDGLISWNEGKLPLVNKKKK